MDSISAEVIEFKAVYELLTQIFAKLPGDASFVVAIDEMQCWSVPVAAERKRGSEVVQKDDYANYFVVAFTQVIAELVSSYPRFKVILIGTDLVIGHGVRLASEVCTLNPRVYAINKYIVQLKCKVHTVPEMPRDVTRKICDKYLVLDGLDKETVSTLMDSVSYNPRALHFFLEAVTSNHKNTFSDEIKPKDIQDCVAISYREWSGRISGYISSTCAAHPTDTFFVACLFAFPSAFNGTEEERGVVVPASKAGFFVQTLLNAGAIRAEQGADGNILIRKPKGFLARYLFDEPPKVHLKDTVIMFSWLWATSTERIGSKGHLFEKILATGTYMASLWHK